jgi:hypothetical protein
VILFKRVTSLENFENSFLLDSPWINKVNEGISPASGGAALPGEFGASMVTRGSAPPAGWPCSGAGSLGSVGGHGHGQGGAEAVAAAAWRR